MGLRGGKKTKFILVIFAVIFLVGGYFLGINYKNGILTKSESVNAVSINQLQIHDRALGKIDFAQKLISKYRERINVEETSASAMVYEMNLRLIQGDYRKIEDIEIILNNLLREAEEEQIAASKSAELNLRLDSLTTKKENYKKQGVNVATVSAKIASVSADIANRNFESATELITSLDLILEQLLKVKQEADKVAAAKVALNSIPIQISGGISYERKNITTTIGVYNADILTVDLNKVKVKTFTANENDCNSDCPVKPLASYVYDNGGIAGINGTYFCPPDYSQCSSVKNSFNTLVFDYKSKKYLNSSQNHFSVNPLISFYADGAYFYTQALGFGRDSNANGVISNHPTLIHNGGVATNPNLDSKSSSKGLRCGIGFRDKTLWAVCSRNVTVAESAFVFQSLGAIYAMNLDGGGSAAMFFNGYKLGPGRQLPNAIVFTN